MQNYAQNSLFGAQGLTVLHRVFTPPSRVWDCKVAHHTAYVSLLSKLDYKFLEATYIFYPFVLRVHQYKGCSRLLKEITPLQKYLYRVVVLHPLLCGQSLPNKGTCGGRGGLQVPIK